MKKIITAVDMICASVILTQTCYAYIDPATTSYVIQIAAGVVIALGTAIGIYWNKIKRVFKKKTEEEEPDAAQIKNELGEEKDTVTADDLLNDD